MSYKRTMIVVIAMFLATVLPLQAGQPKKKPVKPSKQWSGSVDDLSLRKAAPEVILSVEELNNLWRAWKVPGPVPKVDFSKEIVVVTTTQGSRLRFMATLDDKGNLQVGGLATRDLRPGFRYRIAALSHKGVKTVNGKKLAGEAPESSPASYASEDIKAFGVVGISVKSVKPLDVEKTNQEIASAAQKEEAWTKQAVLIALRFTGEDIKGHTKDIEVRTPPEQHNMATVTVTESGYPDDAVGGERWRLWLEKGPAGAWTITKALWARLCSRPGQQFYSAERCP